MQEYIIPLCILFAFVFYQLRSAETNTLLAIGIMIAASGAVMLYMKLYPSVSAPVPAPAAGGNDKDTVGRDEAVSSSFTVKRFGKQLQYIRENGPLSDIAQDVRFVRIFDKARYGDLLIHMDYMQKVYMYILAGRYSPTTHIPIFIDLRNLALEVLYSLVHAVPSRLKHTYGVQPYAVIEKNIDAFTAVTRKMLTILYTYSKREGFTVPDTYYHPYEPQRDNILP